MALCFPPPLLFPLFHCCCHSSLITVMLRLRLCLNFKSILQLARVAAAVTLLLLLLCCSAGCGCGSVAAATWGGASCCTRLQQRYTNIIGVNPFLHHQTISSNKSKVICICHTVFNCRRVAAARHASTSGKCCQHVGNISSYSSCTFCSIIRCCCYSCCSCANWNCTLRLFLNAVAFYLFSFSLFADCSLIDCHCPQTERGAPQLGPATHCAATMCSMPLLHVYFATFLI